MLNHTRTHTHKSAHKHNRANGNSVTASKSDSRNDSKILTVSRNSRLLSVAWEQNNNCCTFAFDYSERTSGSEQKNLSSLYCGRSNKKTQLTTFIGTIMRRGGEVVGGGGGGFTQVAANTRARSVIMATSLRRPSASLSPNCCF